MTKLVGEAGSWEKSMTREQIQIGVRVRTLWELSSVPKGTEGVIDQDYGDGFMVAWDLRGRPLPPGYRAHGDSVSCAWPIHLLRDGFHKEKDIQFLELVEPNGGTSLAA